MLNLKLDSYCQDMDKLSEKIMFPIEAMTNQVTITQNYYAGIMKYVNEFLIPYLLAYNYFTGVEKLRLLSMSPADSYESYKDLADFNMDLTSRSLIGSMRAINEYNNREMKNALTAWMNTLFRFDGEDIEKFIQRQSKMIDAVVNGYPKAIKEAEAEFGFHFEHGRDIKVAETDRFILYQIMPTESGVSVEPGRKPILIIPPYVLGANILAFLPGDRKSYTHYYANMGIPTYIRIMKSFASTPALQLMTGEDDCLDTKFFCEKVRERHGKPVTLNGYCQGGFNAVCNILTGELDGLVDALITCVSPMDGTRSVALSKFLRSLPTRFNDLAYGTKTMPNGNKVADGKLMAWIYKLKSIEDETPIVVFFRDMMMLSPKNGGTVKIPKTAAALNYWLQNERTDLPLGITEMSFASFNTPITSDGTLPVRLFGKTLNFKRIQEKGIKWLICYGERDDLVERDTALAPTEHIDVEVTAFPKGHVAIATSWSDPKSACALHTRFGDKKSRGPVLFQLDIDKELDKELDAQKAAK